ncbi:hypothetical protein Bca4012_053324 [Brassica carinata]|uniref:Secreted protein n=1 Tax=Brassica carinata TaxID=52824 RepID=A0A8X7RB88_BRACI|nr:hypothetical protein Bca52824_055873 [Brassica carinata]
MSAASGSLLQVKYVVFWLACFHANSVSAIREQAKKDSSVDPLMVLEKAHSQTTAKGLLHIRTHFSLNWW